jgi:regulator of protease activity HflC (stomatin/prohibitin superfamily)
MAPLIIAVVLAIFAIVLVASAVRIVRQSHVGMIERFGKYRATLSPGLHIVIPFFDRMRVVVDMRETVQPFAPQPVITEDNVTIAIDTVVYFQVTDAFRATYEVANFLTAMEQLAQTTLRNLVGAMTLEETLTSRDQINTQLREVLDEATEKWGVRVTRVELKSIDPPRSIQEAMEQQMRADRAKRATILQAEGEKQSAILRAEGARQAVILAAEADQQSLILRAEGDRQSRALRARGEAEALEHVFDMVKKADILPSDMLGYKYLEALPAVAAGDANKLLLLPSGASEGMGAVAGLGAAFAQGAAPDKDQEPPQRGPRQRPAGTPPPDEEPPLPERRG